MKENISLQSIFGENVPQLLPLFPVATVFAPVKTTPFSGASQQHQPFTALSDPRVLWIFILV